MDRAIPVSNKLLSRKWEERSDALHQQKLRNIQARVDSASPPAFSRTIRKAKKEQLLEDHYTEIERENRLLLEKMSSIMQGKPTPRTRPERKRSLNQDFRRRELVKITQENQALLRRLQGRTSAYSTYRWETDRKKTERLLRNICEFPYQLGATVHAEDSRRRYVSMESRATPRPDFLDKRAQKPVSTALEDRPRRLVPIRTTRSQELLFKRGINISDKYFLVEVTKRPGKVLISAFDIESPDSYNLELETREALDLMEGERNYEKLVEMLVFEKGELMLVDEKRQSGQYGKAKVGEKETLQKKKIGRMTEGKEKTPSKEIAPARASESAAKGDVGPYQDARKSPIGEAESQPIPALHQPSATPANLTADLGSEPLLSEASSGPNATPPPQQS